MSLQPLNDETWHTIRAELEKMLANERGRLEDPTKNIDETNVSRGRIAAIKDMLALPKKREMLARGIGTTP